MPTRTLLVPALCVAGALLAGQAHAAGALVPWADPIGMSPPLGAAPGRPSVPYADPIGSSRLNPPTVRQPLYPRGRLPQRQLPQGQLPQGQSPQRRCYRAVDVYGRVVTQCTVVR